MACFECLPTRSNPLAERALDPRLDFFRHREVSRRFWQCAAGLENAAFLPRPPPPPSTANVSQIRALCEQPAARLTRRLARRCVFVNGVIFLGSLVWLHLAVPPVEGRTGATPRPRALRRETKAGGRLDMIESDRVENGSRE